MPRMMINFGLGMEFVIAPETSYLIFGEPGSGVPPNNRVLDCTQAESMNAASKMKGPIYMMRVPFALACPPFF
jgi:hypothetical protein